MPIDTEQIINLLRDIAGERQLEVTAKESLKGGLIAGSCAFVGGLLAGPIGLAIGGTVGGLTAYARGRGQFRSVGEILNDLPYERKQRIAHEVNTILQRLEVTDFAEFARLAIMVGTIAEGGSVTNVLVQRFIQESISVIQREITSG